MGRARLRPQLAMLVKPFAAQAKERFSTNMEGHSRRFFVCRRGNTGNLLPDPLRLQRFAMLPCSSLPSERRCGRFASGIKRERGEGKQLPKPRLPPQL